MKESTLTQRLGTLERRVGALEEDASNPDAITRIVKVYGGLRLRMQITVSKYTFRVCSDSLPCSEELII